MRIAVVLIALGLEAGPGGYLAVGQGQVANAVALFASQVIQLGGPDRLDLYIVTADNLDDVSKGGSIFRTRPGVAGVPTPLARV